MMSALVCRQALTKRTFIMQKRIIALLLGLPMVMSAAQAAESMDLVVQVTAVTGSCTPSLDTPVVNFGTIRYERLNTSAPTTLAQKNVRLTITCSSPMAVGWTISDNRGDSVARIPVSLLGKVYNGAALAGLGKTSAGVALGNWTVSTGVNGSVQHDGINGVAIASADLGATWSGADNVPVTLDFSGSVVTSISETNSIVPVPFSTGIFSLGLGAVIAPRDMINLTDDTQLDGSATISLVYL